jgi:hypothetical protein
MILMFRKINQQTPFKCGHQRTEENTYTQTVRRCKCCWKEHMKLKMRTRKAKDENKRRNDL